MHTPMARVALVVGALSCSALAAPGQVRGAVPEEQYRITDLGTLPDCDVTYATGVNDDGWVSGYAFAHVPPGHGNALLSRPFLWRQGKLTELPKLGGSYGQALAINARGDVAGYADTQDSTERPVIWRRRHAFAATQLSDLPGAVRGLAPDGTAGGSLYLDHATRAVVWEDGKLRMVGDPQDSESQCYAVNARGTAVGERVPKGRRAQSPLLPDGGQAVQWQGGKRVDLSSLLEPAKDSHTFFAPVSAGVAINELGVVAGWTDSPNGRQACLWRHGKPEALPVPAGFASQAYSLNEQGVVVGEALYNAGPGRVEQSACRWQNGQFVDLNRLIPAGSGWSLRTISQISNRGLIVGTGRYDKYPTDFQRAFLLTPVSR